MQEDGLKARTRKGFTLTTMSEHDQPVAANLLDRQFRRTESALGRGHDRVCDRLERAMHLGFDARIEYAAGVGDVP